MPDRRHTRRWLLRRLAAVPLGAGAATLIACNGAGSTAGQPAGSAAQSTAPTTAPGPRPPGPDPQSAPFEPVVVTTEQVVGRNRFTVALVHSEAGPITDADVKLRFYKVDQRAGTAQLRAELPAPYHGAGLDDRGVYVAHPEFDEPGPWGLEVLATRKGGRPSSVRANFTVLRQSQTLPLGAVAPRTRQVLAGEPGIYQICSDPAPCDMHDIRIADAIEAGRPSLILFAAPGWCPSQTCAPELNIVRQLKAKYTGRLDFIHVEIYKDAAHTELNDAVREWRLTTEPWVFLVGRDGTIKAKFEGGATADEIEPALQQLLA